MYNNILPLNQHHLPLLETIYNKIYVVKLLCTNTFPQQHYTSHKSKQFTSILNAEPLPKTPYLSTPPSISFITSAPGHEP